MSQREMIRLNAKRESAQNPRQVSQPVKQRLGKILDLLSSLRHVHQVKHHSPLEHVGARAAQVKRTDSLCFFCFRLPRSPPELGEAYGWGQPSGRRW